MARRHSPPPAPLLRNWPIGLPRHPGHENRLRGTRKLTKSVVAMSCSNGKEFFSCRFVSGFRPAFVSCGRRTPQGAAVVTRQARHRLKPCRGDTAACCRKATRRSQVSWSRVALFWHRTKTHGIASVCSVYSVVGEINRRSCGRSCGTLPRGRRCGATRAQLRGRPNSARGTRS